MVRVQVILAAVLFGTTGTALVLAARSLDGLALDPTSVGAARIVVGGTVLAALALVTGGLRGRWPIRPLLLAGAGVALYQVAFFEAVDRTGVAVGAVVAIGTGPVAAGAFERVVDGVWPGRTWALATALALAGGATLVLASAGDTRLSPAGIAFALVAGTAYGGYTVVAKQLLRAGHAAIGVMGASFGIAGVLLAPLLLVGSQAWLGRPQGVALALYLGLLPTALAYVLFARGLQRLSAAEVTTIVLVEPVTATAFGFLLLGERLGAVAMLGVLLVFAGLATLAVAPRRQSAAIAAEVALDDA
ncbi:MAG: EamA family transporter [Thermoleophilia bacterium]|nr:EamA family transporter [Thermoleophilia bacterium]